MIHVQSTSDQDTAHLITALQREGRRVTRVNHQTYLCSARRSRLRRRLRRIIRSLAWGVFLTVRGAITTVRSFAGDALEFSPGTAGGMLAWSITLFSLVSGLIIIAAILRLRSY